ncbi:MAG: methyltransferase domain-containing protein, partial [Acidobacteria bacterium]|nr:methyltransferase domain-containing protein [Acidobacteriota bacterium]
MSSQNDDRELAFTGERVVVGKTPPFLVLEHLLRYRFAARFARGRKVLDVGCGTGYGAALLAEQARLVVGVDNAADAIAYARENYRHRHLHFAQADCRRLPLRDRAFDLVVMFEVIEHIAEQADCLGEIRRALAPVGTLILSTPDVARPTKAIEEFNPFHAKELTEAELRELLRPHFRHVELLYQHELSGSSLRTATNAGQKGVELVEDSSHTTAAKYFLAVCGARPSRIPVGRLVGATGIDHQIAIVRDLRYLEKEVQALLRQREEYIENLAAHRREIEALQRDREQRERDYAQNLAAHQREIEALLRDREARQQDYAQNLAAHQREIEALRADR